MTFAPIPGPLLRCRSCGHEGRREDFVVDRHKAAGIKRVCRPCEIQRQRERRGVGYKKRVRLYGRIERLCHEDGCRRVLAPRKRYCPEHKAQHDEVYREKHGARRKTNDRDYGVVHQRLRARVAAEIAAGARPPCARCSEPIERDQAFHLDHNDDRTGYLGPSHAYCNLAAAARKKNRGTA